MVRLRALILFTFAAGWAIAQEPEATVTTPSTLTGPNPLVTLASEFFEHDYVNVFAYGDVAVDTNNLLLGNTGQVNNNVGWGYDVGGGIDLYHAFRSAELTFAYTGGYRSYQTSSYFNGTTQNLASYFVKRLSRRVSMNVGIGAGQILYGGSYFTSSATAGSPIVTNPFSPETRYLSASLGFNFVQTRRLSYSLYGDFFLARYNYPGSIGTTGAAGGASVNYRITARTSVSGVYSHSYFTYQRNAGSATADQIGLNLFHQFGGHWSASVFGGVARSNASGTVLVPVTLIVNNQPIGGYVVGRYSQIAYFPSVSGTVSRIFRRSILSINGGEGIAGSGNGYFLASKDVYITGIYSYSLHRQNISMAGSWFRLTSVANTVAHDYSSAVYSVSYGRSLMRYVGAFAQYNFVRYGSLPPYNGVSDNRFVFGFNFSSRSVPLTLF
jgi:hypothetical protein